MKLSLSNFVKYCLGYIKLTKKNNRLSRAGDSLILSNKYVDLRRILSCDVEDVNITKNDDCSIKFDVFYKYYPKEVPEEVLELYEKEKEIAQKIDELHNKYRNEQYTKQIVLQFGCFEIELQNELVVCDKIINDQVVNKFKIEQCRIFSLPVKIEKKIEKDIAKYYISPIDTEVQVDIHLLESVLGEDKYLEIISRMGKYDIEGKFTLPISSLDIFNEVWDIIKAELRLKKNVKFNEQSFEFENISLVCGLRSNYFLTEDLAKLSKLSEEDLKQTALIGWSQAQERDITSSIPEEEQLFFPFSYDKYQLKTLSLLKNTCSIIQGPPGTGKSTTIANILCHLAANGNRVLFVSQKAQALKVVKDKLKRLDIKYLFSYIPNPSSTQLGEEDEADGVAPQLKTLEGYIEKLRHRLNTKPKSAYSSGMEQVARDKIKKRKVFNQSIKCQREYYELHKEYLDLKAYDIELLDQEKFIANASAERLRQLSFNSQEIVKLKNELKKIEEGSYQNKDLLNKVKYNLLAVPYSEISLKLNNQAKNTFSSIQKIRSEMLDLRKKIEQHDLMLRNDKNYQNLKAKFDQTFNRINLCDITFLKEFESLRVDLLETAYDGHNSVFRWWNNLSRKLRLRETFSSFPRDLRDYLKHLTTQDISKIEIIRLINSIQNYFICLDQNKQLEKKQQEIISIIYDQLQDFKNILPTEIRSLVEEKMCNFDLEYAEADDLFSNVAICFEYIEVDSELKIIQSRFEESLSACGLTIESFSLIKRKINELDTDNWAEIIKNIAKVIELNRKMKEIKQLINTEYSVVEQTSFEKQQSKCISTYIQNLIDEKILQKSQENLSVRKATRRLAEAFGKSKFAFKTFDTLRKTPDHFKEVLNLIPVWIMELDDASRIIPFEANLFDYVILDEASQCNIAYALPVMFRTSKVLFVGDSEQMRDSTVAFKSNHFFDELAVRFKIPEENRIKTTGTSVQSVLDIAYKNCFTEITLRHHYRSPVEIIGFCNEYFYKPKGKELIVVNNNYLTYKDTNRTMLIHEVQSDWRNEKDDQINIAEAEFILNLFKDLRTDEKTKNKSIGILSFFNKQAAYIRRLFDEQGLRELEDNYKISSIEGVQGDEKDIIIYSFVIRKHDQKNKYIPLTGEGGDIKGDLNMGRVNVAFSRAREQVHCCISLPVDEVPEKIWIKKYLKYVEENGIPKHNTNELNKFDSYFEESCYKQVHSKLSNEYRIQNQVSSCGFKIDFVITNIKTGKKIAIECDGPSHFKDEVGDDYIDSDHERQNILEAAGWMFYRIKYTDWVNQLFDRNQIVQDIIKLLN